MEAGKGRPFVVAMRKIEDTRMVVWAETADAAREAAASGRGVTFSSDATHEPQGAWLLPTADEEGS